MGIPFKIFIYWNSNEKPEIRRWGIAGIEKKAESFLDFTERFKKMAPALKDKSYTVSWKDNEGDDVVISTDEELETALYEMNTGNVDDLAKFYVRVKDDVCDAVTAMAGDAASPVTTSGILSDTSARDALQRQSRSCLDKYKDFHYAKERVYCNATFDTFLCWPPTPAGGVALQHCPPARLSDTTRLAFRRCGETGLWLGRKANESSIIGWTNYTPCFPTEVQILFEKVYEHERDAQIKFEIAQRTRYMEIAGFSISLVALIISLVIFSYYRSLKNNRTRIHKSLFLAMVVQVLIRLTVYVDQALTRSQLGDHSPNDNATFRGIDNMPYLCESTYVMLEYAISVMFMWMFIEGLYLHSVVTVNALRERISYLLYYATGWGLPVVVTALWAVMTAVHYRTERVKKCWYGYNFTTLYWIVQGPRLAIIMVNLVFLLNIMRVLIVKLRQSENSEMEKVRKAARAALVLLPLLGITNALNMTEAPLERTVWEFGLWSYGTHFLRSFQGFFIALIYCFMNGEVRLVLRKHYRDHVAMRKDSCYNRESFFHFLSSNEENRPNFGNKKRDSKPSWMSLTKLKWRRGTSAHNNATRDVEVGDTDMDGHPCQDNESILHGRLSTKEGTTERSLSPTKPSGETSSRVAQSAGPASSDTDDDNLTELS